MAELLTESQDAAVQCVLKPEEQHNFIIFDMMADDTQFEGLDVLEASGKTRHVLAMHGNLSWQPASGGAIRQELVAMPPLAMASSSASVMYACWAHASPVPITGPEPEAAKLRALVWLHDSVEANFTLLHRLVALTRNAPHPVTAEVDPECMVANSPCRQHGSSNCVQPLSVFSGLVNNVFCLSRVMSSGQTSDTCKKAFRAALEDDLILVKPEDFIPSKAADDFAQALLEICYYCTSLYSRGGDAPADFVQAEQQYRRRRGQTLREKLPGDWRSARL